MHEDIYSSYPLLVEVLYMFESKIFIQGFSIPFDFRFTFSLKLISHVGIKLVEEKFLIYTIFLMMRGIYQMENKVQTEI